jgi:serine/threonine-protein kinase
VKSGGIDRVEPGARIAGKYVVERVLGEGGMGIVALARHEELDRKVAIKLVRRGLLDDDEAVQRFQLEARALASLEGDHVVRVLDVGRSQGTPFMVMEYLEGADLGQIAKERGVLPIEEVVGWVIQAAVGLSEAHRAGIVHRDLKPGNLFLARRADGSERIKVLDFGIAKSLSGGPALTKEGYVMGSPSYMSPEQLRSSKQVDVRADVWALGAIVYRLLGGEPPFLGKSLEERLSAILAGRRRPLSELRPDVPAALERVIDGCLEPDPERRIPNVTVLARRLAPFARPESAELVERMEPARAFADVAPPSDPPRSEIARSTPAWKIAAVALLVIALAVGVMFLGSGAGLMTGLTAKAEHADAPLPAGDPSAVDPVAIYPEVEELARGLHPDAALAAIDAEKHVRAGRVDLVAGGSIHYTFEFGAKGDASGGVVQVEVTRHGIAGSRFPFLITGKPVPPPGCTAEAVWKAAVDSGLHADTRPELHYGQEPGRATWVVSVARRPELRREIDGRTCALVPARP